MKKLTIMQGRDFWGKSREGEVDNKKKEFGYNVYHEEQIREAIKLLLYDTVTVYSIL